MYRCFRCNCIFEEPDRAYEEPNYVPAPFGLGEVAEGGGWFKCCPDCGSENYDCIEFNGKRCPCCDEKIDYDSIKDEDNFEYVCKNCRYEIKVVNGDWVE